MPQSEQDRQIERVAAKVSVYVRDFCVMQLAVDRVFQTEELIAYVRACAQCDGVSANGESAMRIMRRLRDKKKRDVLGVENIDRNNGLYRVHYVRALDYRPPAETDKSPRKPLTAADQLGFVDKLGAA